MRKTPSNRGPGHNHSHNHNHNHNHNHDHDHNNDHDHSHDHDHDHKQNQNEKHTHGLGHSHGFGASHSHHHSTTNYNRLFFIGIVLNIVFVVIEATVGLMGHSLALVADAGHNLGDVVSLFLAWGSFRLAQKKPSSEFTYGLKKSSVLAALLNSLLLLIVIGAIVTEAIHRFFEAAPIDSGLMIWVAGLGIVINAATAMLFLRDRHHDLNIRGAFLHMVADALISLGVVVAGVAIHFTHWNWLDPLVSIAISVIIVAGTWSLLKSSLRLSMDAVPEHIDPSAVKATLSEARNVLEVHDLHIWPMSTTETALSAHLVVSDLSASNETLRELGEKLTRLYGIAHSTIQIEKGEASFDCALRSDDVV